MTTNYKSYEWFIKQDLSAYTGKWVSVVDKKIVVVGDDPAKVLEETKSKTSKIPLLAKIPKPRLRIL